MRILDLKGFTMTKFFHFIYAVLLFALFSINPCISHADDERHDGNWWSKQNDDTKTSYIVGFFDGMDYQDIM